MLSSETYPPSDDLRPYIRQFYVVVAQLDDEQEIEDFLISETASVRILLKGDWTGKIQSEEWRKPGNVLFFAANEFPLKVKVKGSFTVAGFVIRPCGWSALFPEPHHHFTGRVVMLENIWGELAGEMMRSIENAEGSEGKIAAMEEHLRLRLKEIDGPPPDPQMAQFEQICLNNCAIKVSEAAEQIGLSVRQLERRCKKSFGLTPKAILRRSRFLDMGAAMKGFSTAGEADLAALRFFDQSHVAREFKRFTHMTPTEYAKSATPLHNAALQVREQSRQKGSVSEGFT